MPPCLKWFLIIVTKRMILFELTVKPCFNFIVLENFRGTFRSNLPSTKIVKYWIFNISGNIEAVFSNLAPEMFITKDTKPHLLCCCHDNNSATGPALIKTTIPSFCLNQGPSTPVNLMVRVKTIWLPCLLQTGASVLL